MKRYRFIKADPCGNTTVFICDPVPREQYCRVAQDIMACSGIGAEQVGFIHDSLSGNVEMEPSMTMMGGEFCGNASRCFAAWLAMGSPLNGQFRPIPAEGIVRTVRVSGYSGQLCTKTLPMQAPNCSWTSCEMPLPQRIEHGQDDCLGPYALVLFEGISHLILWAHLPAESDLACAKALICAHGGDGAAYGVLYCNRDDRSMKPLVCVSASETAIWETSCGSGSCAIGAALAELENCDRAEYAIQQPGGALTVGVSRTNGHISGLTLGGPIIISASGYVYLNETD